VIEAWSRYCRASLNNSNTFADRGMVRFFEMSRTEHADGAITGAIWTMCDASGKPVTVDEYMQAPGTRFHARRTAAFRIEGDGTVSAAPAILKRTSSVQAVSAMIQATV
jgi:hypothetical protein